MTPSVWLKSTITPIPKNVAKDPHIPLHYRGISLLLCVCKGYSSILNKRIVHIVKNLIFLEIPVQFLQVPYEAIVLPHDGSNGNIQVRLF